MNRSHSFPSTKKGSRQQSGFEFGLDILIYSGIVSPCLQLGTLVSVENMYLWAMSDRSLEESKYLSDKDEKSDDGTSSSRKRRAEEAYLASVGKAGSDGVQGRPRKTPKRLKEDLVKMVQNVSKTETSTSAGSRTNTSDLAGPRLEGVRGSSPPGGIIPGMSRVGQSPVGLDNGIGRTIVNVSGATYGARSNALSSDLLQRMQQSTLPATAVPAASLVRGLTEHPFSATSHQRLHQMASAASANLQSSFLQQRLLNHALGSRLTAVQELMELNLLQSHLMNHPSAAFQQQRLGMHQPPNLPPAPQFRNLLRTLPMAPNNHGTRIDPSTALSLNPYRSASVTLGHLLAGAPSTSIHRPAQAGFTGRGQLDAPYGASLLVPRGFPGHFESLSGQRQQQEASVMQREDVPVLSRDFGRCEPMELDTDSVSLSPFQCLARKQIEFFEAKASDVAAGARGRNNPITLGQVGIRCRHCSNDSPASRGRAAVYFPTKFDLVYQTAVNMTSTHLCIHCKEVPKAIREELVRLKDQRSTVGGGKAYWAKAATKLGIIETQRGLRFKE